MILLTIAEYLLLTWAPPDGWWIIILEFGNECRMPASPAASNSDPMEAACPTHLRKKKKREITFAQMLYCDFEAVFCLPCGDWWFYILHSVINGHASGNTATRRVNVHVDWFCAALRLFEFKEKSHFTHNSRSKSLYSQHYFTCKKSNWATISELILSLMPPIKQMIRSFSKREKISYDRSPRPVCSITIGTKPNIFLHVVWICRLTPEL